MNATLTTAQQGESKGLSPVQQMMSDISNTQLPFGRRLVALGQVLEANKHRIFAGLPSGVSADRMIRVVLNAIRSNPALLDCHPVTVFDAVTEAATMGWEIGGVMGHAYLVPFGKDCTMIPGYKGLLDLCYRSGNVQTISMQVVRQGDQFSYTLGDDPKITHVPNDSDPQRDARPITHAYVVAKLKNGGIQRDVWAINRLYEHRDKYCRGYAKAVKYLEDCRKQNRTPDDRKLSPWQTAEATMCMKTVVRNMIMRGMVPVSVEYRDLINNKGMLEDSIGMDTLDVLPPSQLDGPELLPPASGDSEDQDILAGVEEKFASARTVEEAEALYASLCGPNVKPGVTREEDLKLVNLWVQQARERITGKKKQSRQ